MTTALTLAIDYSARGDARRSAPAATSRRRAEQLRQRVLVVDDQPQARRALVRVLAAMGLEALEADDGAAALTAARTQAPDLVLLDAELPGCDGFEVCRLLRAEAGTALLPIVMVTGHDSQDDRIRGADAGADDFFVKPFETTELMARVRNALRQKKITDELEQAEAVLFSLARTIEGRDADTEGHCGRLAWMGEQLGRQMGLPSADCEALRRAGFVHDIGKIVVPDAVLLKRGPLTPDEWVLMREHPAAGERICAPLHSFRRVLPIIRHHHERLDGSGYPDRLAGDDIPVTARVLSVVDVFDALTMPRPYKRSLSQEIALETMESEVQRGWWDPRVFDVFRGLVRRGALVQHHDAVPGRGN